MIMTRKVPGRWFALAHPYPLIERPPQPDGQGCTASHIRNDRIAWDVEAYLRACARLHLTDVGALLGTWLRSASPIPSLNFLTGQTTVPSRDVRDNLIWALGSETRRIAVYLPDGYPEDAPRIFTSVSQVFLFTEPKPKPHALGEPRLVLINRSIYRLPLPTFGSFYRRQRFIDFWRERVAHEQKTLKLTDRCICHTLQAMREQGDPGPETEKVIFGKGGDHEAQRQRRRQETRRISMGLEPTIRHTRRPPINGFP